MKKSENILLFPGMEPEFITCAACSQGSIQIFR